MKNILELNHSELKEFLLKNKSYVNFDMPPYFDFSNLLNEISSNIWNNINILDFFKTWEKPTDYEDVNYTFLNNKDWNYEWRPLQIIHPFLYVFLVNTLSNEANWNKIKERFTYFKSNNLVECISIPVVSESRNTDKWEQIMNWWSHFEQESIILWLDYKYLLETDITDCYSSFYTHSVSWAIHDKEFIKTGNNRNKKSLIWNKIDIQLMNMSNWQTNWIPQWSILMDFIAEIILWYADSLLSNKIRDSNIDINSFKILRYRDDYRIFTNNKENWENILKILTEVLHWLWLKLSKWKTNISDDIVKLSIKKDKYHLIQNLTYNKTLIKKLFFIKSIANDFPNSWIIINLLDNFNKDLLSNSEIEENILVLTSIIVDIMIRNPRTYSLATTILSRFISEIEEATIKEDTIKKILEKFKQIPNTGHLEIWLQRIIIKLWYDINFEEKLCKMVDDNSINIWESSWLINEVKNIITNTNIIDNDIIAELDEVIDKDEVSIFWY